MARNAFSSFWIIFKNSSGSMPWRFNSPIALMIEGR